MYFPGNKTFLKELGLAYLKELTPRAICNGLIDFTNNVQ